MAEEQKQEEKKSDAYSDNDKLYDDFCRQFPFDDLQKMDLKKYTSIKSDPSWENSFCYWIERKTNGLGSINGGNAYKFGIFRCATTPPKDDPNYLNDTEYAWCAKYGDNRNTAFKNILKNIIDVATAAKNGDYAKIDDIDLGHAFKWKIAFLYSGKKLIGWFSRDKLLQISNLLLKNKKKLATSKIESQLIKKQEELKLGTWEFASYLYSILTKEDNMQNTQSDLIKTTKELLKNTKNLILHGAPGTGKTYLAREIAKEMGCTDNEVGFVQFHPSYDYTDFVEGIRPINSEDDTVNSFKKQDGIFKKFCEKALENFIDSEKTLSEIQKESSLEEKIDSFIYTAIENNMEFKTKTGNKFYIIGKTKKSVVISIPANEKVNEISLSRSELQKLLYSATSIKSPTDVTNFLNRSTGFQQDSYLFSLYNEIKDVKTTKTAKNVGKTDQKNFVFIIDEINRGELSKIFGELFFSIDPGYRGKEGKIRTQYANMQDKQNKFDEALGITDSDNFGHFFVPENVYIIGTMNDIDRSVESMDLAMRRRFTFKEITADNSQKAMLTDSNEKLKDLPKETPKELTKRMKDLNNAIWSKDEKSGTESGIEGLSSDYQIGAAYFLKFADYYSIEKDSDKAFQALWEYNLAPLLREYLRGQGDVENKLNQLEKAYNNEDNPKADEQ